MDMFTPAPMMPMAEEPPQVAAQYPDIKEMQRRLKAQLRAEAAARVQAPNYKRMQSSWEMLRKMQPTQEEMMQERYMHEVMEREQMRNMLRQQMMGR